MQTIKTVLATRFPKILSIYRTGRMKLHNLIVPRQKVFEKIHSENLWGDPESISGGGSTLSATAQLREQLPETMAKLNIRSFLDIPCGDLVWMKEVKFGDIQYIGADIVPAIITQNQNLYAQTAKTFQVLDLVKGPLPKVDMIFVRDCFIHLSFRDLEEAMSTIVKSGSKYLCASTDLSQLSNHDIRTGSFRRLNLQLAPLNLPEPLFMLNDDFPVINGKPEGKSVRRMGIWAVNSLQKF